MPISTRPAATSSCVDNGLEPVTITSAPPRFNTVARYAVFASKWTLTTIVWPLKVCSASKRSPNVFNVGIKLETQSIFLRPSVAKFMSLIKDCIISPFTHTSRYNKINS